MILTHHEAFAAHTHTQTNRRPATPQTTQFLSGSLWFLELQLAVERHLFWVTQGSGSMAYQSLLHFASFRLWTYSTAWFNHDVLSDLHCFIHAVASLTILERWRREAARVPLQQVPLVTHWWLIALHCVCSLWINQATEQYATMSQFAFDDLDLPDTTRSALMCFAGRSRKACWGEAHCTARQNKSVTSNQIPSISFARRKISTSRMPWRRWTSRKRSLRSRNVAEFFFCEACIKPGLTLKGLPLAPQKENARFEAPKGSKKHLFSPDCILCFTRATPRYADNSQVRLALLTVAFGSCVQA